MEKPLLYIVTGYLPSLRYYQKLIPALKEKYKVKILLLGKGSAYTYCKENSLDFDVLLQKQPSAKISLKNIPIITPLKQRASFIKLVDSFLKKKKPSRLILSVPNQNFYIRAIIGRADKLGIDTFVLQWALGVAENHPRYRLRHQMKSLHEWPNLFRALLLRIHRAIVSFLMKLMDGLRIGPRYFYSPFQARQFAVINEGAKEHLMKQGCPAEKIKVVGNLDLGAMEALITKIKNDANFKPRLLEKYGLDSSKKQILLLTTTFHLHSTTKIMTFKEQIEYFKQQILTIREIFPKQEAQIIFKIHPREEDIYSKAYADLGVVVLDKKADVEELMAICDLYISHPLTSTSFALQTSKKDAIFINLTPLDFMDRAGKHFNINHVVKSKEEFLSLLRKYKKGNLKPQYDASNKDGRALERILELFNSKI